MSARPAHPLTQALESIEEKVKSHQTERQQLASELEQVVSRAQQLLADLNGGSSAATQGRRRGRPSGTARRGPGRPKGTGRRGRPPGRKMSAEARRRISEAQKARWAKQKAGGGKKK